MPTVSIKSNGGPLKISYTISTPKSPSTKSINPALPTVVLLHPLYLGQVSMHGQFADARLRRFNLVALDLRCHGDSAGCAEPTYGAVEAVDDVVKFLEALKLPPVHLVGVNLGALVALELAALWPQRVTSLSLISPPSLDEPADVAEGRREIAQCWMSAYDGPNIDTSALLDAICGALQLGFNNLQTNIITSLVTVYSPIAQRNWNAKRLADYERATVNIFTERSRPTLRGIACPVQLIHCGEDIAYDLASTEELRDALQAAGVQRVSVHEVADAPQWGHITHPAEINALIHDMVVECAVQRDIPSASKTPVASPYAAVLAVAGLRQGEDDDSDDESN